MELVHLLRLPRLCGPVEVWCYWCLNGNRYLSCWWPRSHRTPSQRIVFNATNLGIFSVLLHENRFFCINTSSLAVSDIDHRIVELASLWRRGELLTLCLPIVLVLLNSPSISGFCSLSRLDKNCLKARTRAVCLRSEWCSTQAPHCDRGSVIGAR